MEIATSKPKEFDAAALIGRLAALEPWSSASPGSASRSIDLAQDEAHFLDWLRAGFNGEMAYMARHGVKRTRPAELLPGTVSCISVRMDYWPEHAADADGNPGRSQRGLRIPLRPGPRLPQAHAGAAAAALRPHPRARWAPSATACSPTAHRCWKRPWRATPASGWIGKHTNLIDRDAGSYFFLGEIYLDLDLPSEQAGTAHCGTCSACMPACPTGAIVAPYRLDARRCISYLTIELAGPIPLEFRRAIGNRIYGCDDCQLVCPWNKFARPTAEKDFAVRHGLDHSQLAELFSWSEAQFLERTAGSAIRRIGYERWLRNIAVALGNAPTSPALLESLRSRAQHPSALVREHVHWALAQHSAAPAERALGAAADAACSDRR